MSIGDDVKGTSMRATLAMARKAIASVPDTWIRGGRPDPLQDYEHSLIGAPVSRVDGPLKVKGEARFAAEIPLAGILYAALVYSTIPKGRLGSLDTSAALAAPGVALVMTYHNAPRLKPVPYMMSSLRSAGNDDIPVMQDDLIHWNGQPIAVVLAETQEQADQATTLLQPVYETLPADTGFAAARAAGVEVGSMLGEPLKRCRIRPGRWRGPSAWTRNRYASCRPMSVAASAANHSGSTTCLPPPRRGWWTGPSDWCSRARAFIASSAAARSPSSGAPSARSRA